MTDILILCPSASRLGGGVPVVVRQQARALAAIAGNHVRVFALRDADLAPSDHEDWNGIDLTTFGVIGTRRFGLSPAMLAATLATRPDLVHVHGVWQFQGLAALTLNLAKGTPIVITPHGMLESWIRARSTRLKALVSRLYQNRLFRRSYAFQVLTDKEREDVAAVRPGARCALIPNFADPVPAETLPPPWWRDAFAARRVYLFFGRLHEKKGCLELCAAWDDVCRRTPGFRDRSLLVFAGPADGIDGFEARAAALNAAHGNVMVAGPQFGAAKQATLSRASFLCLPSKSEGLPMAILEGWAAGIPAIMTTACNLPTGFTRGAAIETGTDPQSIAASLNRADGMDQFALREMAAQARTLVAEEFSERAVTEALMSLYESAIQNNQNG
jgi:glycosyltransferase involved in cell wall biosynthesis